MKKNNLHVGILWADPYCSNLGVAALAYSSVILFEEVSHKNGIQFEYTLWGASRYGCETIDIGTKTILIRGSRPFSGGDVFSFVKRCFKNPLRLGTLLFPLDFFRFDLVADIGAGDSYSDIYGITHFRNINFTKKWSRILNKKYILLPQTIGPFSREEASVKASYSISKADLVFVRDKLSFNCIQELLPGKPVEQTIDVAFFLPYTQIQFAGNKIKVGVNISGLLWHGGYTDNNQFGLKSDYKKTMNSILDYLSCKDDLEMHLISHVIGDKDSVDEDSHVVKELHIKYPKAIIAPAFQTPIEAKSYISGMDFFIGARMHACIAAISSGVPVYPLAYSRKFNGLFCETLEYSNIGDLVSMDTNEIVAGLHDSLDQRIKLKTKIKDINRRIIEPEKENMVVCLSKYLLNYEL